MSTSTGWGALGLTADPAPGDPGEVRTLAGRLLREADLADHYTTKLREMSGNSDALGMRGDYAAGYRETLKELPDELAKLVKAYQGAGNALTGYADGLEQAKLRAGAALRQGQAAAQQYLGAETEIRAYLKSHFVRTGTLYELEAAVRAAAPEVQVSAEPALRRARQADADRQRAARLAAEAAELRGDAEDRCVRELDQALGDSGVKNRSGWRKAFDWVKDRFDSWDSFVSTVGVITAIASAVAIAVAMGVALPAAIAGAATIASVVAVVGGVILLADAVYKLAKGKGSVGEVAMGLVGILPPGRLAGPVAKGAGGLSDMAGSLRAGGGHRVELGGRLGPSAGSLRSSANAADTRAANAATSAWQSGRKAYSDDPVYFPSGAVYLPQRDVDLPGVLPLFLDRAHLSPQRTGHWFGTGWSSTFDQRLEADDEGVYVVSGDGTLLEFPIPGPGPVYPVDGPHLALRREEGAFTLTDPATGRIAHFAGTEGILPITAVTDRNGNRADFIYMRGVLTEVAHSGGYHLDVETHRGLIVSVRLREAGQILVSYTYDDDRRLTEVINSSGRPLTFGYDGQGRLTRWQDRNGCWYAYTYDDQGRCVRGTGTDGVFDVEIEYADQVTHARDSLGGRASYHYNDHLQVVRETDRRGGDTLYRWNRDDRMTSRTDPLGHTHAYAYDDTGALTSITRPDGARRLFTRDDWGLPTTVTDYDGTEHVLEYDERGNLVADEVARYTYDDRGRLTAMTDALGQVHIVENTPSGLATAVHTPSGELTRYDRDAFGRVVAVTDPLDRTTRLTWSVEGLMTSRTLPGGATERWSYDGEGNLVEHVDALGSSTRHEIGPFDVTVATTGPSGRYDYRYDTELRLTAITGPDGRSWLYAYDPAGGLVQEADVDGRVVRYTLDAAGRLTERVNGAGQVTRFTHDPLGRLVAQRSGERTSTFEHDALGRLTRAVSDDADLRFDRDARGRIVAETCNGRTLTTAYDALGRRVLRQTPAGARSEWEYDAESRPVTLRAGDHVIRFEHDPAGRETSRRFDGALTLTREWDADSQLTTQTLTAARRVIQRSAHEYRTDGLPTAVDDLLTGRRDYDLDPTGRVTAVTGPNWSERYVYDDAGRLTEAAWPGSADQRDHDRQYTWDADDRLVALTTPGGDQWRYLYDALGRRIAKERSDGGGRVDFVWDRTTLAEQVDEHGTTVWEWEADAVHPIYQAHWSADQVEQRFYSIVTDLVGSPAGLVDPSGDQVWRARQSLWGVDLTETGTGAGCPLRFPGQYADEESGLHYNYHRYYDPATARYLTSDPIGAFGGFDPHAYVFNPTSWIDPLGLAPYRQPGLWTIAEEKSTRVLRGGPFGEKYYEQPPNRAGMTLWWSKDKADHAVWKVYEPTAKGLKIFAEANAQGDFVPKHKSPIGAFVKWKDLH